MKTPIIGLKLTDDKRAELEHSTLKRAEEIMKEMGIEGPDSLTVNSFVYRRHINQLSYDGDYTWRKEVGTVFEKSNFTKGSNKRYTRQLASRIKDDLVGTDPFFATFKRPRGGHDDATVKQLEEWVQSQVESSNLREGLREGILLALIRNEVPIKIAQRVQSSRYFGPAEVAVSPDGRYIKTRRGEYVYRDDDIFEDPTVQGVFRLKKDPTISFTGQLTFTKVDRLDQVQVLYDNVDVRTLDYRSFFCPLDAACIHEADMIGEIRDIAYQDLTTVYGDFAPFKEHAINYAKRSGERQPKEQHGEDGWGNSDGLPTTPFAEIYRRIDIDGDNYPEELFMVVDLAEQKLVFADYLHNHLGKRPYEILTGLERVPGRWYGVGVFEMMYDHQLYIDAQFNRVNVRDNKSDSIRFRRRNAVKEWKDGANIVLGSDKFYEVEPGQGDADDPPAWVVNLTEPSEGGLELMRTMEQAGDLMFGAISAMDASASQLNESKTATGVINRDKMADRLTKGTEEDMIMAVQRVLFQTIEVVLENMDPVITAFDEDGSLVAMINRSEARDLEKHIRLLLTKSRSVEQLSIQDRILVIANQYFELVEKAPRRAFHLRPIYITQLKALEQHEAEKMLPELTTAEVDAREKSLAEQARAAADPPPKEFVQYKDTPPSVRRQMEAAAGYTPATEQESRDESSDRKTDGGGA